MPMTMAMPKPTTWGQVREWLAGVPGIAELRVAPGEHGRETLYVVQETHDVDRDFEIAERLFPRGVDDRLVPLRAVGMIPPGERLQFDNLRD